MPPPPSPPYAVGTTTTTLVDTTRLVYPPHTADGKPDGRTLSVSTRYPALGTPASGEVPGAPPSTRTGPYPLVVFAPGYDQTSQPYAAMLDAWARAGYVVASPVFPLTNPATPGGPDENDIVNQPADVSFVIGQLLAQSSDPGNYLRGMIDPTEVALAGQSDGASTALAAAADTCCKDARVKAEIIMAGQEIDISNGSYYPAGTPPLLAMQGTDDTINDPGSTYQLFDADPSTKFLVKLIGADHLSPFTDSPSFEPIVARVSTDFLDHYLKNDV
ncbi:MAG: alpha/beta hydrolase family protein, partial [Acidimicrobiales bacterium]